VTPGQSTVAAFAGTGMTNILRAPVSGHARPAEKAIIRAST
jgi:hypothetical protein